MMVKTGSQCSALRAAGLGWMLSLAACVMPENDTHSLSPLVVDDLFDKAQPDTMGLSPAPRAETFTVFQPGEQDYAYNHGAVVMGFKGKLYAQWQSSYRDEDAPETEVRFSVSTDEGESWGPVKTLVPKREGTVVTNGGWWTDGDTLVAYINVWPETLEPRGGYAEYVTSTDGRHWSEPKPVLNAHDEPLKGVLEQDVRELPDGRLLTAVHRQPGLIAKPYYTDDPLGVRGWTEGTMDNLDYKEEISRELEPSWYTRADGSIVMIFRDQGGSHHIIAASSTDNGESWSRPVLTNFPDSRAKQSAGNLPDGTAFVVNNPSGNKTRIPLTLTLSDNGHYFDQAYWLRSGGNNLQKQRFEGRYKRAGYSYPKSYRDDKYLYVAYATNKEDIEITRVPLSALRAD